MRWWENVEESERRLKEEERVRCKEVGGARWRAVVDGRKKWKETEGKKREMKGVKWKE